MKTYEKTNRCSSKWQHELTWQSQQSLHGKIAVQKTSLDTVFRYIQRHQSHFAKFNHCDTTTTTTTAAAAAAAAATTTTTTTAAAAAATTTTAAAATTTTTRIHKRSSPHCAANCLQHARSSGPGAVQITCNTSNAYHVQHVVLRATWNEGTAQLLSLAELKSHLFEL